MLKNVSRSVDFAQEHSLLTTIEYIKQLYQIVPNVNNRYKVNKLSTHAH